jgi:hypothetical protein
LHLLAMLLIVLGNASYQIASGDRIPANEGFGYDGYFYGTFARDVPNELPKPMWNERLQRIGPSVIVWCGFQLCGIDQASNEQIIGGFVALNLVCMAASVILWHRLASLMGLGTAGRWFGFVAVFVNFANAKHAWYYPVLTDCTVTLLGFLLCYAFVRRSLAGLMVVVLAGSFASSALGFWSLPLFLGMRAGAPEPVCPEQRMRVWLLTRLIVEVSVLLTVISYYVWNFRPDAHGLPAVESLVPISTALAAVYLILALLPLLAWQTLVRPLRLAWSLCSWGVPLWLFTNLITKVACEWLRPGSAAETSQGMLKFVFHDANSIFLRSVIAPLIFLVCHVVYAGPFVLILMLHWRALCKRFGGFGLDMVLFAGLVVILALDSETRHLLVALPFLALFAGREIDEQQVSRWFWAVYLALSIAFSAAWLTIGNAWSSDDMQRPREFPVQWYYMFQGPWVSLTSYAIQATAVLLALICFGWLLFPVGGKHVRAT